MDDRMLTVVFGLILAVLGLFPAVFPDRFARLRTWQIRDAEPSDAFVLVTRIVGIALILIGLCVAAGRPIF